MQKSLTFIGNHWKTSRYSSNNIKLRVVDIRVVKPLVEAGVAKLGQRRWDEVPVLNGSQVRILPSALSSTLIFAEAG